MAKKGNAVKNLTVGLKALGGGIVAWIAMALVAMFTSFLVGGWQNIGPGLMVLLAIVMLLLNIIILGYVYRSFWNWK